MTSFETLWQEKLTTLSGNWAFKRMNEQEGWKTIANYLQEKGYEDFEFFAAGSSSIVLTVPGRDDYVIRIYDEIRSATPQVLQAMHSQEFSPPYVTLEFIPKLPSLSPSDTALISAYEAELEACDLTANSRNLSDDLGKFTWIDATGNERVDAIGLDGSVVQDKQWRFINPGDGVRTKNYPGFAEQKKLQEQILATEPRLLALIARDGSSPALTERVIDPERGMESTTPGVSVAQYTSATSINAEVKWEINAFTQRLTEIFLGDAKATPGVTKKLGAREDAGGVYYIPMPSRAAADAVHAAIEAKSDTLRHHKRSINAHSEDDLSGPAPLGGARPQKHYLRIHENLFTTVPDLADILAGMTQEIAGIKAANSVDAPTRLRA